MSRGYNLIDSVEHDKHAGLTGRVWEKMSCDCFRECWQWAILTE